MGALIAGIVLVTPSCLPNPFEDNSPDGSGDVFNSASSNTSMLEGIWEGTLDYPDYGHTSSAEVEFLSSGQALYFLQGGQDLFLVDPSATVQCDVSSSFAVNVNVQYGYYEENGEYVSCEIAMIGAMDPAGDYLSASGTQTFTTSVGVFVDTIDAFFEKRSGGGSGSGSGSTSMLEGIWEGTLNYPDYGHTSSAEVEFLSSGQALYFLQDGVDLFSVDPFATVQCDVLSSFAVNVNVQYGYYDAKASGEYISCEIAMIGDMDPAGDYLSASGTQTFTTSVGVFVDTIDAFFEKRSGLLRGDGEGPGHNPWAHDAFLPMKRSGPGYPWYRIW